MNTRKLTGISLLFATVVVLQLIATLIPMKPFTISLVQIPIVIGACIYGRKTGALLGTAFGIVVLFACIAGADAGGHMLWEVNPFATAAVVIVKGAAAGYVSGAVYSLACKKNENSYTGGVLAAAVSPIVNTGVFCISMILIFKDTLSAWAGGTDVLYYVIFGLVGVNFLIEFFINLILSPAIVRVIKTRKRV